MNNFFVILEFEIRAFLNSIGSVLGQLIIEPLVYLAFFAAGIQSWQPFVQVDHQNIKYLTFAFPGILSVQIIRSFARTVYRITVDRRWGIQAIKMMAGTNVITYVLGMTALPIGIFISQALVATPFALLLGADFHISNLLLALFFGAMAALFWNCLAILITIGITNYTQRDLIINLSIFPIMFAAPVFYPFDSVPSYLRAIGSINPLTYQITAMRDILLGKSLMYSYWIPVSLTLIIFVTTVFCLSKAELLSTEH